MSIVYLTLNQFLDFASFEFYCVIRISVLRILKSSKYAKPDAKEGHSDTDTSIPRPSGRRKGLNPRGRRGCTRPRRIVAAAGRGRRLSRARGRSSRSGSAPREHRHDLIRAQGSLRLRRGGLGSAGSWPCTSTGRIPYKNKNQRRVYAREQGGGTPDRTADAPERATREIRSPQVNTLHRKAGARWSTRDQRTDTLHGKAVDSCGQRGAVPRLSTAVGRRPTGCTELARCAGPALPASTAPSSAQSSHGRRGS